MPRTDLSNEIDERLTRDPCVVSKPRDRPAKIVCSEARRRIDGSGQEPFAERAERDQPDAEFLQYRQDLSLRLPGPQRVLALQRGHRKHAMGSPDRRNARFGQPEMPNLAFADEVLDRARHILHRHLWVDAMLVVQVDVLGTESPQAPLEGLTNLRRATVHPTAVFTRSSAHGLRSHGTCRIPWRPTTAPRPETPVRAYASSSLVLLRPAYTLASCPVGSMRRVPNPMPTGPRWSAASCSGATSTGPPTCAPTSAPA